MSTHHKIQALIIVGPKHSGKSTIGRLLASLLNYRFLDLDEEIAKDNGESPRELFLQGKEVFQAAEHTTLSRVVSEADSPYVLATGGGIVDNTPAWELLKSIGTLIYLGVSAQTAWQRIATASTRSGSWPPFLSGDNRETVHRELHERRAERCKSYCDINIDAEGHSAEYNANIIISKLRDTAL